MATSVAIQSRYCGKHFNAVSAGLGPPGARSVARLGRRHLGPGPPADHRQFPVPDPAPCADSKPCKPHVRARPAHGHRSLDGRLRSPAPLTETLPDPAHPTDCSAGNAGHCYRVAHWTDVGLTTGRARAGRHHLRIGQASSRSCFTRPRQRPPHTPASPGDRAPRRSDGASIHIENCCVAFVRSLPVHGTLR
jgi:hypothetical protein